MSRSQLRLDHQVIMRKLSACGVSGNLNQWISSYLEERQQKTVVNGVVSENEYVQTGAPQGSLLGPRLFSLTANNLPDVSNDHADDTTGVLVIPLTSSSSKHKKWSMT